MVIFIVFVVLRCYCSIGVIGIVVMMVVVFFFKYWKFIVFLLFILWCLWFLLVCFVVVVFMGVFQNGLDQYNLGEEMIFEVFGDDFDQRDNGWKLIRIDVFCFFLYYGLFCVVFSMGVQFLVLGIGEMIRINQGFFLRSRIKQEVCLEKVCRFFF